MSTQRSMQRTIRRTLLAMALVALGATGTALAQPVPDTLLWAPNAKITRESSSVPPSVDVYFFDVDAGDTVTVDIDTAMSSELDTVLSVVDPRGRQLIANDRDILLQNDPASVNQLGFDAYAKFTVTADTAGKWQVSVTADPFGGVDFYGLLVTRVKPPAPAPEQPELLGIKIDIKPYNHQKTTPIKMGERHIRVALLSKRNAFDPFAIHVDSLRFGPTGTESSFVRCAKRGKDRNGDRKPDRVCRFDIAKTTFTLANTVGMVTGTTRDGKAFQGVADVKVLAQHHKDRKHHDDDDDDD